MAKLYLYRDRLRHNFDYLEKQFKEADIEWAIVTKLLCGNKVFLKEILDLAPAQVCDSRISNLKTVKEINPNIETVYIKPPAQDTIKNLVRPQMIWNLLGFAGARERARKAGACYLCCCPRSR